MNRQTNDDESRTPESWLSSLARVYGPWHLGITAIQSAAWTAFVYWNESGKQDAWADVVQTTVEKMLLGVPGASILSIIALVGIEKVVRMAFTFLDERRKRIETAREEGREEMRAEMEEMRAEMREEIEKALAESEKGRAEEHAAWTAWNARRIEAERRGERFDEPPPSLNGR